MPSEPMPSELLQYASALFAPEDDAMQALTLSSRERGMPEEWEISPDVGKLFQVLCRLANAKRVLEFGTFAGHSALWFARALPPGGKVVSIELNSEYAAFAREMLSGAGVGEKVEVRVSPALEALEPLRREVEATRQPWDVIFLDADKVNYPRFLEWSLHVLRPGGLLLADNVLRAGSWNGQTLLDDEAYDPRILAMREFNSALATHPAYTSVIVPMRAGIAVAVRTR